MRLVRRSCSIAAGAIAWVAALAFASPGQAYVVEPVVEQNIPTISDHVARNGAVQVSGVSCGSMCTDLLVEERRAVPGQPLHDELRGLRSRAAKVLPPLNRLGTVALVAETFHLGWKMGEGSTPSG